MYTTAQSVMINANVKKGMDWAISSRASSKEVECSTIRSWSLKPEMAMAVKTHERGGCISCVTGVSSVLNVTEVADMTDNLASIVHEDGSELVLCQDCSDALSAAGDDWDPSTLCKTCAGADEDLSFNTRVRDKWCGDACGFADKFGLGTYAAVLEVLDDARADHGMAQLSSHGMGRHIERIFSMARDGNTSSHVADAIGVKTKSLTRFASRHGIRFTAPIVLADLDDDIRLMADAGATVPEIAEEIGFSSVGVHKYLKANGIDVPDMYHTGTTLSSGYRLVYVPDHPDAGSKGYVREHRLVMEQQLGRRLTEDEVVHHKDGDRLNNALDNLELMSAAEHSKLHAEAGDSGWAVHHSRGSKMQ